MTDNKVTLSASCVSCERPLTLSYHALRQSGPTMYSWVCPYPDCGKSNTIGVHGSQPVPTVAHSPGG